jgi:hypothetical protein
MMLSVIIVMVGDTVKPYGDVEELKENLSALHQQLNPPPFEVIVPFHSDVPGIEALHEQFPSVNFLLIENGGRQIDGGGSREHHDKLRAKGIEAAQGEIIALMEDHVRPAQNWGNCIIDAQHNRLYSAIGGAIENEINRPLNWAVYFCDLGKYQNPLQNKESLYASVVNVSYRRAQLDAIHGIWENSFNETLVHNALLARGDKIGLSPDVIVYQHRMNLVLSTVLKEFYIWGNSYARHRSTIISKRKRFFMAVFSIFLPFILLLRMSSRVMEKRRFIWEFTTALPFTILITIAWSFGEFTGYLSPSRQGMSGEVNHG